MSNKPDPIEAEYLRAIQSAEWRGDNDAASELAAGLREYRRNYKTEGSYT
jgi:hypothetical protein